MVVQFPLYISVGIPLGKLVENDNKSFRVVRTKGEMVSLDAKEGVIWEYGLTAPNIKSLIEFASRFKLSESETKTTIKNLIKDNLMLELRKETKYNILFSRIRVIPLGHGRGIAESGNPKLYQICDPHAGHHLPVFNADLLGYLIWSNCDGARSLIDAYKVACKEATVDFNTESDKVFTQELNLLPSLMQAELAFVDFKY